MEKESAGRNGFILEANSLWRNRPPFDVEWKPVAGLACDHKAFKIGNAWYVVGAKGVFHTADYFISCHRLPRWRAVLVRLRLWVRSALGGKP